MSGSAMVKAAAEIMNNTSMSAGKKAQELGNLMKSEATFLKVNPNTKAAAINIGKWGALPAAAGIGAGVGIGVGAPIASAGVQNAFGYDPSKPLSENVPKYVSWVLFGVIVVAVLYFLLPQVKKVMK